MNDRKLDKCSLCNPNFKDVEVKDIIKSEECGCTIKYLKYRLMENSIRIENLKVAKILGYLK